MKPIETLLDLKLVDGQSLELLLHDQHFYLHWAGNCVDSTYAYESRRQLAEWICAPFRSAKQPKLLLLGLGLGNSLEACLEYLLQKRGKFVVYEPHNELISWKGKSISKALLGEPKIDQRVAYDSQNWEQLIKKSAQAYQAILIDTLNLGVSLNRPFGWQGDPPFYQQLQSCLAEGGMLGVLLEKEPTLKFKQSLIKLGFRVTVETVPVAAKGKQNRRHSILLARWREYNKQTT